MPLMLCGGLVAEKFACGAGIGPERKPKALRAAKSIHLEGVSPIERLRAVPGGIGAHELSESGLYW